MRAMLASATLAVLAACQQAKEPDVAQQPTDAEPPAHANAAEPPAAKAAQEEAGRYTSIDPARCRLIEQNVEEGGYSLHKCAGLAGYQLETSESDLRQDIVIIAPGGGRSELQLSSLVANGAFNSLGKTAEWRGVDPAKPQALIVRLNVVAGPEPTRPDISNLVVARLAAPACVVAVLPPGPEQNAKARQVADGDLPGCID